MNGNNRVHVLFYFLSGFNFVRKSQFKSGTY